MGLEQARCHGHALGAYIDSCKARWGTKSTPIFTLNSHLFYPKPSSPQTGRLSSESPFHHPHISRDSLAVKIARHTISPVKLASMSSILCKWNSFTRGKDQCGSRLGVVDRCPAGVRLSGRHCHNHRCSCSKTWWIGWYEHCIIWGHWCENVVLNGR